MINIDLGNGEAIKVNYEEYLYLLSVFYPDFKEQVYSFQEAHLKRVFIDKGAVWLNERASKKDCENVLKKEIISTTVNNLLDKL